MMMAQLLNKKYIRLLLIFIQLLVSSAIFASSQVNISLFNDYSVKTLVIAVIEGEYELQSENYEPQTVDNAKNLYVSLIGNTVCISGLEKSFSTNKWVRFVPVNDSCRFSVHPVFPAMDTRNYDGGLTLSVDYNRILMVNTVDYVEYIAGVVQAEGGTGAGAEYYKVQSVLCQTYLLKNIDRHITEGFNLCDGTHCQAFNGYTMNEKILNSVGATQNMIVVDKDSLLITAVFHSNSGGQTESSKSIWLMDLPYLQQVKDPYALKGRNVSWQKTISLKEWKNYLSANGMNNAQAVESSKLNFIQEQRRQFYVVGDFSVPVKKIREDWNLKSSFFNIEVSNDKVVFDGKGYGHGVGLCQEGAMQMAVEGFSYPEIIKFYFQGVKIIESGGL